MTAPIFQGGIMVVYLIENDGQVVLEFPSVKKMREWAKKHGHKVRKSPLGGNWYYTEAMVILPTDLD